LCRGRAPEFSQGAEDLFLTQPAVRLQIKALEKDLGVRLFDHSAGKISLTWQGSVLLTYANQLAQLVFEAQRELTTDDGKASGELALDSATSWEQGFAAQR